MTVQKNGKDDYRFGPNNNYGYQCFCYIHNNPVVAKMVKRAEDYHWSSAKDYAGLRDGDLCNIEIGENLIKFREQEINKVPVDLVLVCSYTRRKKRSYAFA